MNEQGPLSGEFFQLAEHEPRVAVTILRFCVGPRLNNWLRSLPLHSRVYLAAKNDRLTSAERLVHVFDLQPSSLLRREMERQVSLPLRMGSLGLPCMNKIWSCARHQALGVTYRTHRETMETFSYFCFPSYLYTRRHRMAYHFCTDYSPCSRQTFMERRVQDNIGKVFRGWVGHVFQSFLLLGFLDLSLGTGSYAPARNLSPPH